MTLAHTDQGDGRPVVLLHGFPLDRRMWREQVAGLRGDYRVIAPDLSGFGGSAAVDDAVTMETYAEAVEALLGDLGVIGPVALAGFSMGGYVAFEILRRQRVDVGALALVDTKAAADTPEARDGRHTLAAKVREEGAGRVADAMLPKLLSSSAPETLSEEVHRMMATQPAEAVARALEAMAARPDSTPLLGALSIPTLVVSADLDEIIPAEESRRVAGAIPGAVLVELAGTSHLAPMEAPSEVNAALSGWLERW